VRLRLALEELGPIFVKFGQALSTRRDLLPADIADELAKLQDRVPPFPGALARSMIEQAYGTTLETRLQAFEETAARCRVDRPGTCRPAQGRTRSHRQGAATRHAHQDRTGSGGACT
jgi:hypothetical protein